MCTGLVANQHCAETDERTTIYSFAFVWSSCACIVAMNADENTNMKKKKTPPPSLYGREYVYGTKSPHGRNRVIAKCV